MAKKIEDKNMINTGDKLLCRIGNNCYLEGETYIVGKFVNGRYFELMTGSNNDHWYATMNNEGIYVRFNAMRDEFSDAWFDKINNQHYS
ncbi:hypothetical protein [Psychrobacter sp. PL15]|uniref:hypothetical protein n=1 Tax=Psychrobacter sp. PL15 TaxID=3071719 RepID=UPI002E117F3B